MADPTKGLIASNRELIRQMYNAGNGIEDIVQYLSMNTFEGRQMAPKFIRHKVKKFVTGQDYTPPAQSPKPTIQSSSFARMKTELGLHTNEFGLPDPLNDEIQVYQLPVADNKILLLPDVHVPFHDVTALTAAIKYGVQFGVNTIYINGDGIDFYGISRFEKEKRLRSLKTEIDQFREFIEILGKVFPNARKYYKIGNHCARWDSYIRNNAKEFEDIDDFAFANVMRLNQNGWTIIGDRDFAKAGKLHILHGHELMQVTSPVNPARGVFMKAMQSVIVSHHHRTSEHSGKNIGGDFITCWSTGCLSQLRPKYNPLASYNHGFAIIETESGGDFHVHNKRIDHGKIY